MKRGQAWSFDLMVASSLFIIGIIIFFLYAVNSPGAEKQKLDDLTYEGNLITEDLMSTGSPNNWDITNVIKIGILSDNKINDTKLEKFYNLSLEDYQKTKTLFDTKYNYFVNFSDQIDIAGNPVAGIGVMSENPSDLIKITRFTIYKNKPTTLNLYIWDQ